MGETVELSTGAKMPMVGLGTWQSKPEEINLAVRSALDEGYRLIDTAAVYMNETEIGKVLADYFNNGKLKREQVFVTTKLWCDHNQPDKIEQALRDSLKRLQLDYVDLYLIHIPAATHADGSYDTSVTVVDTWKGMESVFDKGLTKAIGLSNFNEEQTQRVYDHARIKPHNNQVEAYLYWPQTELYNLCKRLNITFTAFAPIGSPGRSNFVLPNGIKPEWPDAPEALSDPVVKELAEKHKKTHAQILLRWLLQHGMCVIPKSVNPKRIKENFQVFDFSLSPEEMKQLNSVKHRQRLFGQSFIAGHPEDPFKNERTT